MELIVVMAVVFGIAIGCLIMNIVWFRRLYGVFKIDCTDPNKDICRLELNSMDLDALAKREYIVLKVDTMFDQTRD